MFCFGIHSDDELFSLKTMTNEFSHAWYTSFNLEESDLNISYDVLLNSSTFVVVTKR